MGSPTRRAAFWSSASIRTPPPPASACWWATSSPRGTLNPSIRRARSCGGPARARLKDWQARHAGLPSSVLVAAADVEDALDARYAGAAAILPRSAVRAQIAAAIEAAISGLAIVPHDLLATLLDPRSPDA